MKTIAKKRMLVLSGMLLALSLCFVACVTNEDELTGVDDLHMYKVYDESFDAVPAQINVTSNVGDVSVKESVDGKIRVEIYANQDGYHSVNSTGDTLTVKAGENVPRLEKYGVRIIVYVPRSYDGSLSATAKTGDVAVTDLPDATLVVDFTTGNAKLGSAKNVDVHGTTGDVSVAAVLNKLSASTVTGSIFIGKATLNENSKIQCTTGDIMVGSTNAKVDASSVIGKCNVTGSNPNADVTLKITVVTGSIVVR